MTEDSRTGFGLQPADNRMILYPLIVGIIIIVGWQYAVQLFNISTLLLPPPTEIYLAYRDLQQLVNSNLASTLMVAGIGFFAALLIAFVLAVALTLSDKLRYALMPLILSFNTVPRVALAPLIVFYIGGFDAKYLISAWVAFFPMVVNTYEGIGEMDEDAEMLFTSVGASKWQELVKYRIPNAVPFIVDGMKIGIILAIVGAIVGEFVASDSGAGYLALVALGQYNVALMFAIAIIMGFIAVVAFYLLYLVQSRLVYWESADMFSTGDTE
jgi:NitT/TauT family transport system permease protein